MTKRVLQSLVLVALVGIVGFNVTAAAQQAPAAGPLFRVVPVQGNIWMVVGDGANVVVSLGRDGLMVVDSGTTPNANKLLATLKQLATDTLARPVPYTPCVGLNCGAYRYPWGWSSSSFDEITASPAPPHPIRYVLNTSVHPDRTGGNAVLKKAGVTYVGGNITGTIADAGDGAAILAFENVANRLTDAKADDNMLPTETYGTPDYKLSWFFNNEGVQLFHVPNGYSDGDSLVYFRYSDVVVAGEIYNTVSYPIIDVQKGGTIDGVINGLSKILDLSIAEFRSQGGTMIIPGRGRVSDVADVTNYRNMVYIIRDRIKDAKQKGKTLEQVKAAKLTLDYDGRYGATTGPWTTDMFVTAVYQTVK